MSDETKIKQATLQINEWRKGKNRKTEKLPIEILKIVSDLMSRYSINDLSRRMGLSHKIFKSKRMKALLELSNVKPSEKAPSHQWTEVPVEALLLNQKLQMGESPELPIASIDVSGSTLSKSRLHKASKSKYKSKSNSKPKPSSIPLQTLATASAYDKKSYGALEASFKPEPQIIKVKRTDGLEMSFMWGGVLSELIQSFSRDMT